MKIKTLPRFSLPKTLALVLALASAYASPEETSAAAIEAVFIPEFQLGQYLSASGLPLSLEGGFSALFLFTEALRKGKPYAQSFFLGSYAAGGYSMLPASFIARAGLRLGDPRTGSLSLGTVFRKKGASDAYAYYFQGGISLKLLEIPLGRSLLLLDILVNYTYPRGAPINSGETLMDCVEGGIILLWRLPPGGG